MVREVDFCIDAYEYPNQKGRIPTVNLSFPSAKALCEGEGKRLCTDREWETACMGLGKSKWPYGNQYKAGSCADAGDLSKEGEGGIQPAGAKKDCTNDIGAYDMSGNVWEWVQSTKGKQTGILKGGGWNLSAGLGQCRAEATAAEDYRAGEVGVRCCITAEPAE